MDKMENNRILILDSSSIITLALTSLLFVLEKLKQKFNVRFVTTQYVLNECVKVPLNIKRFELEALMIKKLVDDGIIEIIKVDNKDVNEIMNKANTAYKARNDYIKLIHAGEASCIALYNKLQTQEKAIVIDERTTRMLCENPENLRRLLERKLHTYVSMDKNKLKQFSGINVIRSSEIVFIALKQSIITEAISKTSNKQAIDALLYALKFHGCAISKQEINEAKSMV